MSKHKAKVKAWGLVNEYGLNWLACSQIKEIEFRPLAFQTRAEARIANKRLAGLKCRIERVEIRILPNRKAR